MTLSEKGKIIACFFLTLVVIDTRGQYFFSLSSERAFPAKVATEECPVSASYIEPSFHFVEIFLLMFRGCKGFKLFHFLVDFILTTAFIYKLFFDRTLG